MATHQERETQRRIELKKIFVPSEKKASSLMEIPELADMDPRFAKYVSINKEYSIIDRFTCPVEGCGYDTDQGPGFLRMHMLICADPKIEGRYCPRHEAFMKINPNEMTIEGVRYLSQFSSKLHLDTAIKNIKE